MAAVSKLKYEKKSRGKVDIRDGLTKMPRRTFEQESTFKLFKSEKSNRNFFFFLIFFSRLFLLVRLHQDLNNERGVFL